MSLRLRQTLITEVLGITPTIRLSGAVEHRDTPAEDIDGKEHLNGMMWAQIVECRRLAEIPAKTEEGPRMIEPANPQLRTSSPLPYLLTVVAVIAIAIAAIVIVDAVRHDHDNTTIVVLILGFSTTTVGSTFAYLKTNDTHRAVNSDLAKWIEAAGAVAYDRGFRNGAKEANQRTDKLAKNGECRFPADEQAP